MKGGPRFILIRSLASSNAVGIVWKGQPKMNIVGNVQRYVKVGVPLDALLCDGERFWEDADAVDIECGLDLALLYIVRD
jgi:hypothetical protein